MRATLSTCLCVALLSLPLAALADPVSDEARALAEQQRFAEALARLERQDAALKAGYEHRLLRARILAWDGQHARAAGELDALLDDYPGNADALLMRGQVEYYRGDLDAADRYYREVLAVAPGYADARSGLEATARARAERSGADGARRWRVDASAGVSDFDLDGFAGWDNQFLRGELVQGGLAYSGSVQRYRRFGATDIEFGAGLSDAVRGGWDWSVSAGLAPDADFRPDVSLGATLGRGLPAARDGLVIYPALLYRYDDYDTGAIHNLQPGVTAYFDGGAELSGRLIATLQSSEPDQLGWLARTRLPVADRLSVSFGFARAPEAIDGVAVTTESVFGGVTYTLSDALDVHLDLVRDDREDSYIRRHVNVGLTYRG